MPIVRPVYPNELYHYGVKGMHWGIRRYQPYPKGYSGKGRYLGKRSRVGMFGKKKTVKHLNDEQRNWVVNKAPLSDVISYSDQLTTEERIRAANRIESERRLHSLRYSGALKKYNDITTAVGNTSKILKTGLEIKKLSGDKNQPPAYTYDSMSTYYDNAKRNGTGADWSGIYGGKKVDKLTNKERDERREKLRKRRRNLAIGLGVGGAAALGAGLYLNSKYKNKARLLNASSKISADQADKLLNNAKNYEKQAKMVGDSANELIKRGEATGNRAMLNTAKAQLLGNANLLIQGKANAVQAANLTNRATRERLEALNYDTRRTYAKLLAGTGGLTLSDAALYGYYARKRKLKKKQKRRR